MTDQNDEMTPDLNAETGKIEWKELERHYARGVIIKISQEIDLVKAATSFTADDKDQIERWITSGDIERAQDEDAKRWTAEDPLFWAVVVAPWVLIQEIETPDAVH